MGILKNIFGAGNNAEKIVDGAISGLDKAFFTREERNQSSAQLAEWYLRYLEASQPQNLARRLVALIVVGIWALLVVGCVALYRFDAEWSAHVERVLADTVMNPFLMIMGFYYATHVVRTWQGSVEKKK